jgi:hypothetical protein
MIIMRSEDNRYKASNMWETYGMNLRWSNDWTPCSRPVRSTKSFSERKSIFNSFEIIRLKLKLSFYTYLPKKPSQSRPRTFIVLPYQSDEVAAHFIAAHNDKAENEIEAHIGMFGAKTNPGYYELGLKTAHLIREAVVSALVASEKTMKVNDGEVFDEEKDLARNRLQVGQDGREAEATGSPDKPEGV